MSTALLLSAGKAERLGGLAPGGCKAMVEVGGRSMLDWWRDAFPRLIVACRSEHNDVLPNDVPRVICNEGGGPARALRKAMDACDQGPITVIYADTWVPVVPRGPSWCAVAPADGGRKWYVAEDGLLNYRYVDEGVTEIVGVGLFRFPEKWRLTLALEHELAVTPEGQDCGLDVVSNDLGLEFEPVLGWQDVGDPQALEAWSAA